MRNFSLFFVVIILFISANAQQSGNGTIHGKVVDVQGALVRGATVKITNASGAERTAQSNQDGEFSFNNLAAGKYSLAVAARGFALYENAAIDISAGKSLSVDVTLSITVNEK